MIFNMIGLHKEWLPYKTQNIKHLFIPTGSFLDGVRTTVLDENSSHSGKQNERSINALKIKVRVELKFPGSKNVHIVLKLSLYLMPVSLTCPHKYHKCGKSKNYKVFIFQGQHL